MVQLARAECGGPCFWLEKPAGSEKPLEWAAPSQDEFGKVGVLRERADLVADIVAVDLD